MHNQAADNVGGREKGQDNFGIFPDNGDEEAEQDDGKRRLAARPGDVFEAVVADGAGHERAEGGGEKKPGHGPTLVVYRSFESVDERGDEAGRSGCREADEIF